MDGRDLLQSNQSRENLIIPDVDIKNERIKRRKAEWYEKNKERLAEKWSNDPKRKETQKNYYKSNKKKIMDRAKRWNKENHGQRKIIQMRWLHKKSWQGGWNGN